MLLFVSFACRRKPEKRPSLRDDNQIVRRQVGTFRFAGPAELESQLHDPFRRKAARNSAHIVVQLRAPVSLDRTSVKISIIFLKKKKKIT